MHLTLAHNHEECPRNYRFKYSPHQHRVLIAYTYRDIWACDGCAAKKIGDRTKHLLANNPILCQAFHSNPKRVMANSKGLGYFSFSDSNDTRYMVGVPRLFPECEPTPIDTLLRSLVDQFIPGIHSWAWGGGWVAPETSGKQVEHVFPDQTNTYKRLATILEELGMPEGYLGKRSWYEVSSLLDQRLNGVSFISD